LKEGNIILKIEGKEVNSVAKLQEEIGKRRPGAKIKVSIRNNKGSEKNIEIVLRNKEGKTKLVSKEEIKKNFVLGATFSELSNKEKKENGIEKGVKIKTRLKNKKK
jgi:PDZ domain-containing secreted protein